MSKKKAFKVGGKELGRFIKMRKSIIKNKKKEAYMKDDGVDSKK